MVSDAIFVSRGGRFRRIAQLLQAGVLEDTYGSKRAFLRHLQYQAVWWWMQKSFLKPTQAIESGRVIFVCQGNICRSALAQAVAEAQGLESRSYGLDTVVGKPADPRVVQLAARIGYNLAGHGTTPIGQYRPRPHDFVLLMQPDHRLRLLAAVPDLQAPIGLLGNWATPKRAYIHDPFAASDAYMDRCLRVIESSVLNLSRRLKHTDVR
jgi:protein-tyrosine phosphatase